MSRRSDDEFPRPPWRRRLIVAALAVATAVTVVIVLLERPGDPKRGLVRVPAERPPCTAGQSRDCVGGTVDVQVVPAAPQGSAPAR
jgi:hypothetical protein